MTGSAEPSKPQSVGKLLLGGVLPLIIYTFVEEYYGTFWGLICGMVFGVGEILYEKLKLGKVEWLTWLGNGLLLFFGGISLLTSEGVWFKLQPAILEAVMGGGMLFSHIVKKPFMVTMARKQNLFGQFPEPIRPLMEEQLAGFNFRCAFFFFIHAAIATWAAFHWSTRAWVILKGVGFTGTFFIYGVLEMIAIRKKIKKLVVKKS